nr:hypothetical protein CFP56_02603 [Quercus suber]
MAELSRRWASSCWCPTMLPRHKLTVACDELRHPASFLFGPGHRGEQPVQGYSAIFSRRSVYSMLHDGSDMECTQASHQSSDPYRD